MKKNKCDHGRGRVDGTATQQGGTGRPLRFPGASGLARPVGRSVGVSRYLYCTSTDRACGLLCQLSFDGAGQLQLLQSASRCWPPKPSLQARPGRALLSSGRAPPSPGGRDEHGDAARCWGMLAWLARWVFQGTPGRTAMPERAYCRCKCGGQNWSPFIILPGLAGLLAVCPRLAAWFVPSAGGMDGWMDGLEDEWKGWMAQKRAFAPRWWSGSAAPKASFTRVGSPHHHQVATKAGWKVSGPAQAPGT